MNDKEYKAARHGDRVRTVRSMRNAYVAVPVGAIGTITYKHGGFNIDFDACGSCGMRARMQKVSQYDVVPL